MEDRWLSLLHYWQYYLSRHALTFSFLVGALRKSGTLENRFSSDLKAELTDIIDSIRSHKAYHYHHYIYRCPDLDVLVIRRVDGELPAQSSLEIENPDTTQPASLFASRDIHRGAGSNLENLLQTILDESGDAMQAELYSRNGKEFAKFSDYDLSAINKAMVKCAH